MKSIAVAALLPLLLPAAVTAAPKTDVPELIRMADQHSPQLAGALRDTLGAQRLQQGTAVAGYLGDFIWAVDAASTPELQVDDQPPIAATRLDGDLWLYRGTLKTGTSHKFHWIVDGKPFGGQLNVPAFTKDSYPQPGVPQGKITGPIVHESTIYPGMKANYWYYVPAQYDGSTPAAVMVWQDGQGPSQRTSGSHALDVLDNLTAQKRIPVMVSIFVQPGTVGTRSMRSVEYDSVNDTYSRYLLEEIIPEVGKSVKLRTDGYSRAMQGGSSGGICSFNAAWQKPDQFSRVLSWIGSFTSIQWKPGMLDGGNIFPFVVRREPKRNIRVWMQDGTEDLENQFGSWPLQNIQLANSLKMRGYDYHFTLGVGDHNGAQGSAQLPEALTWLWRDYDPSRTSQEFTQDPAEKDRPYWRVVKTNRTE